MSSLYLSTAYDVDRHHRKVISRLLSLTLMPAQEIPELLESVCQSRRGGRLEELMAYVDSTWTTGHTWKPADWSGYGQPVRTNNDVEG